MSVDRGRGALIGLACGDAVGTTVEFCSRGSFEELTDMIGGGPFGLEPGQWTDDTSMALCLAESLLECEGFNAEDQLRRYVRWYREGHLSSTGRCFDIGNTVRQALHEFEHSGETQSGPTDPWSAGNGSIMRLAPIVLAYSPERGRVREFAAASSKTTHGAVEAVVACEILGDILVSLLAGVSKDEALLSALDPSLTSSRLGDVVTAAYREKTEGDIKGTGYVVDSLEAALWCFWKSSDFEEAILRAANLGDDADTTAAVCGQLAGAYWGLTGIPLRWRERLAMSAQIEEWAGALIAAAF